MVPRSAELQAAEDALSLALVAMVGGTKPAVSLAMVRDYVRINFGIVDDAVSMLRHAPQDFIVRFRRREDLEAVLGTPVAREAAPFTLIWRRWTRFSNASAGSFTFRVLVGIKGVSAHALSQAVGQYLLGSSCAMVELATADADGVDVKDGREIFVAAWCVRPGLIPDQKILVIPEPAQPHDPCGILFLREHGTVHCELPTLRYLAHEGG